MAHGSLTLTMPRRTPILRAATTHAVIADAIDAMRARPEHNIDEYDIAVSGSGRLHTVSVSRTVPEDQVAGAAAYLAGYFDAKGIGADVL